MPARKYVDLIPSAERAVHLLSREPPPITAGHQKLYVFDTDATGVPGSTRSGDHETS